MTALIADARRIADAHALYRMFDERDRLLYVGITGDAGQRFGDHSVKRWFVQVKRIDLEWLPHLAAARVAERRAISSERPRYNKAGLQPPRKVSVIPQKRGRKRRTYDPLPASETRDLLTDLDEVLGDERIKLRDVVGLLRRLEPSRAQYQKMTAVRLQSILKGCGVRTINTSGTPYLDPADLRRVRVGAASIRNSA